MASSTRQRPLPHPTGVPEAGMHIMLAPVCPVPCPECNSDCGEPIGGHNLDPKGRPEHLCSACRTSFVVVASKPLKGRRRL